MEQNCEMHSLLYIWMLQNGFFLFLIRCNYGFASRFIHADGAACGFFKLFGGNFISVDKRKNQSVGKKRTELFRKIKGKT